MAGERRKRVNYYVGPRERIKRAELPAYEATGEWVAEVKHDGVWCLMTVERGTVVSLTSRTAGALSGPLLGRRIADAGSGQLAGELVADMIGDERTGTRRLHLFEPLTWNDIDLRDLSLEDRREALMMIVGSFTNTTTATEKPAGDLLYIVERRESGFLEWYDAIMGGPLRGSGAEGLVLKKRGTAARAQNADGKVDFWRRCKPLNTVDYVVIGPDGEAAKGTPKIALGLYKQTKDGRRVVKVMSPTWPANMKDLKAGDVVEVEGAEVFPSGAVRHGHIKRLRTDKPAEDCTYEAAVRI